MVNLLQNGNKTDNDDNTIAAAIDISAICECVIMSPYNCS